jgi:hypothetical protein
MNVDIGIPLDADPVSDMDVLGPGDDHPGFNVNILPVGPKKKTIFNIGQWIPEPFPLHSGSLLSKIPLKDIFHLSPVSFQRIGFCQMASGDGSSLHLLTI